MESTLIVALARQMAARDQVEAVANNIANVNTTGYKGERTIFNEYLTPGGPTERVVFPRYSGLYREMQEGPINATGNSLDVALRGKGFFAIETPAGVRYTRDGHFSLNAQGEIVNGRGLKLRDDRDRPIRVPEGTATITITADGTISAGEQQLGKLKIVRFENEQRLQRAGEGLYATDAPPLPAENVEVVQGSLEASNVQPILEVTRMIEASRVYQSAKKIVDGEDERMRKAIEKLAKVA